MEYGAIDLHKKESQIQILTESGSVGDYRIVTTRERFTHVLLGRPGMRILIEASTESQWVAQHLEQLETGRQTTEPEVRQHAVISRQLNSCALFASRG